MSDQDKSSTRQATNRHRPSGLQGLLLADFVSKRAKDAELAKYGIDGDVTGSELQHQLLVVGTPNQSR